MWRLIIILLVNGHPNIYTSHRVFNYHDQCLETADAFNTKYPQKQIAFECIKTDPVI